MVKKENLIKYGQSSPPAYDLSKFKNYKIKSMMTLSNADPFSKKEDCQHVFNYIPEHYIKIKNLTNYNHLDYLWSSDAKKDLYYDIIDFLK